MWLVGLPATNEELWVVGVAVLGGQWAFNSYGWLYMYVGRGSNRK